MSDRDRHDGHASVDWDFAPQTFSAKPAAALTFLGTDVLMPVVHHCDRVLMAGLGAWCSIARLEIGIPCQ